MKKIVIALGGNALGDTALEQLKLVEETAKPIADLIEDGNQVIIAHGNGPQVGMINLGMNYAYESGKVKGEMPFPECGAMSQGYIGYHLQNAIGNEFSRYSAICEDYNEKEFIKSVTIRQIVGNSADPDILIQSSDSFDMQPEE